MGIRHWWLPLAVAALVQLAGCGSHKDERLADSAAGPDAGAAAKPGRPPGTGPGTEPGGQNPAAEAPAARIRLSIGGKEVVPIPNSVLWRAVAPVPPEPMVRFSTELKPIRRVIINIFECDERGELSGGEAVSVIDPRGETLVADRAFNLAEPPGCLIWRDRALPKVPLAAGGHYRLQLRIETDREVETLSVTFRVKPESAEGRGGTGAEAPSGGPGGG